MSGLFSLLSTEALDVAALERIYRVYGQHPMFVADAISAMRQLDPDRAFRAAWLLCRRSRDTEFDEPTLARIATCAEEMDHWISRLTLCQFFSRTGCPPAVRESLYPFLADCFNDRRVIIRAWALSALVPFADEPKYRPQVKKMMLEAQKDPSKAMQARLRHLEGTRIKRPGRAPLEKGRAR